MHAPPVPDPGAQRRVAPHAPIRLRDGAGVSITATSYLPGTSLASHHHAAPTLSLVVDGAYDEEVAARRFGCAPLARDGESPSGVAPAWLRRARDYLDANIAEPIGLAQAADEAGVHPSHLAQSFRRCFGCSVGEYVRERRLDLAERLLATTKRPVGEIAIGCGFADNAHMTRAFRVRNHVTPSAYRALRAG
jgi:AraC-like DNA-binding protein